MQTVFISLSQKPLKKERKDLHDRAALLQLQSLINHFVSTAMKACGSERRCEVASQPESSSSGRQNTDDSPPSSASAISLCS